ncbi:DUF2182 domain-containing protein [Ovoidimarina sediminis]|uniref:DUF2182 domain-containing protein n=1 Tax=Ovoidimarina sediminis TaxID=3079856 RepID=UPI002910BC4B|nr:DUF2182 domain-containing protein [Rhodophyticola sp. MJ-SS7]MDU8944699.1 DUF2182 domain-containing protein [Rhodophyticola sp. MJ-SS7]
MGGILLADRIRSLGAAHWLGFFGAVLIAWALMFWMAAPAELRVLEGLYGAAFIETLCGGAYGASSFLPSFAMWTLMSAAMMAPTALPALATYDDLSHVASTGFGRLLGGYLAVWIGFSALAALAQVILFRFGLIGSLGQSLSLPLTMALLIGAGVYQFSALKEACLSRCRAPLTFFMQHWDEGPFRNGIRLGTDCLGCCWALMLLGFVGGTMNLVFMGLAMVLMMLEKLPEIGRHLTKPTGLALIAAGLALPLF